MTAASAHSSLFRASRRRHWLCIAYAFPPVNRSGTHRTLAFVRHLHDLGWDATVLTVDPMHEPLDESLLDRVPSNATIIRTPWRDLIAWLKLLRFPTRTRGQSHSTDRSSSRQSAIGNRQSLRERVSRLLITPDSRIGWLPFAVRAGLKAIRGRRPDVIYSTSPYMSAHLIALVLHHGTRIPWVADFRDPWVDNPFRNLSFPILKAWDSFLEWLVLRSASRVVCNTATMAEAFRRRRPWVARKCTTILNGIDRDLLSEVTAVRITSSKDFVFTHCGQFYGPRSPCVWFAALARIRRESPKIADRIHLLLIGGEAYNGRPLAEWASEAGVGDQVHIAGWKCHAEALSKMAGSDALILSAPSGTGGDRQVPNKLFEYLGLQRPLIAAVPKGSPIVAILRAARADAICCPPDDERAIADAIVALVVRPESAATDLWSGVHRFDRVHRAVELVELFRRIARSPRPASGRVLAACTRPAQSTLPTSSRGPLDPVEYEGVGTAFASDGGLRPVTGEDAGIVGQGHQIVAEVPH